LVACAPGLVTVILWAAAGVLLFLMGAAYA